MLLIIEYKSEMVSISKKNYIVREKREVETIDCPSESHIIQPNFPS